MLFKTECPFTLTASPLLVVSLTSKDISMSYSSNSSKGYVEPNVLPEGEYLSMSLHNSCLKSSVLILEGVGA